MVACNTAERRRIRDAIAAQPIRTVAYALAFARAVEAALGTEVPARAVWLRALLETVQTGGDVRVEAGRES